MQKIETKIYGNECYRISKAKARNLCKNTHICVYMCMVNINPTNKYICPPMWINMEPLQPEEFEKLVAEYLYFNRSPQAGYYASFYADTIY